MSVLVRRLALLKPQPFRTPHRSAYVVTLPEVPPDTPATNPLLQTDVYPAFASLTPNNCIDALGKVALEYESGIWKHGQSLADSSPTFEQVFMPLERLTISLDHVWGITKLMYMTRKDVLDSDMYKIAHGKACLARGQRLVNDNLYNACKALDKNSKSLSESQKRLVSKYVLEGQLNGMELSSDHKTQLKIAVQNANENQAKFVKQVETYLPMFRHVINDPNLMRDFPHDLLKALAIDKTQPSLGPWKIKLTSERAYDGFLAYCPDDILRWNVFKARNQLATVKANESSNSIQIEEIRYHRRDQAKLLGYNSYADMSMKTKMADSVENVRTLIGNLRSLAYPAQVEELESLQKFATSRGFDKEIQLWDIPFFRRKQIRSVFGYDERELREYLQYPKVLKELFSLCERLFSIKIEDCTGQVDVWNSDVSFYRIYDSADNKQIGSFYIDPFQRPDAKPETAMVINCRSHLLNTPLTTDPLAGLIFSFFPPSPGCPSLLTLPDVELLFSKMGHALQLLLTKVPYSEVAGVSNVEWDAVDISSHVMSSLLYNSDCLLSMSAHYVSGQPLPTETIEGIRNSRTHMAGYDLCRQLYFSDLDLELFSKNEYWLDVVRRLWPKYCPLPVGCYEAHPCSWKELFSGEYAAAYYSRIWSAMVAADAFGAFREAGVDGNQEALDVGKRFRSTFLSLGGSCHPLEVFRRFRGRDPSPKALLYTLGLKKSQKNVQHSQQAVSQPSS